MDLSFTGALSIRREKENCDRKHCRLYWRAKNRKLRPLKSEKKQNIFFDKSCLTSELQCTFTALKLNQIDVELVELQQFLFLKSFLMRFHSLCVNKDKDEYLSLPFVIKVLHNFF